MEAVQEGKLLRQALMNKYDVKRATLATYVKNEAKIMETFKSETFNVTRKRLRTAAHPELKKALFRRVEQVRSEEVPLSGELICQQAEVFALKMGIDSFKASGAWFTHFKEALLYIQNCVRRESFCECCNMRDLEK